MRICVYKITKTALIYKQTTRDSWDNFVFFPTFTYTKSGAVTPDQIDAISGATITTNALVNGVNAGMNCFKNELGGGANE